MKVSFIVDLDIDEPSASNLLIIADELSEDLFSMGHEVLGVKPWERPSLAGPSDLNLGLAPSNPPPLG